MDRVGNRDSHKGVELALLFLIRTSTSLNPSNVRSMFAMVSDCWGISTLVTQPKSMSA